jgi:hypothetical protein
VSWYDPILDLFRTPTSKGRRKDVHYDGETPPSEAMDPMLAEALRTRPSQDSPAGGAGVAIVGGYIFETERNADLIGPKKYARYNDNVRNCDAQAVGVRAALMLMGGTKWDIDPPLTKTAAGQAPSKPGAERPGQEEKPPGAGGKMPEPGKPPRAAGPPEGAAPAPRPKAPANKLAYGDEDAEPTAPEAEGQEDIDVAAADAAVEDPIAEEARLKAEWLEDVLFKGMLTPWSRVIRRMGMFKFHGHSIHEWTAKRRDDGTIGIYDLQNRPQTTIERWDMDRSGTLQGVVQRIPLDGKEAYIPRWKMVYVVDDEMADGDPQGVGLFRHSANKVVQLRRLEQLEGVGYETDLRGIPLVYAPIAEMDAAIEQGKLTPAQKAEMLKATTDFMEGHTRNKQLAIRLDSTPYRDVGPNGSPSATRKWSAELLTGGGQSHEAVSKAIDRKNREIARTLFAEGFLLGGDGGSNRALGEEKNRFFADFVNSVLTDVCDALNRDVVKVLWALNGYPDELCPTLRFEAVSVTDVAHVADMLEKMAKAGAKLDPRDPVVNTVRARARLPYVPDELVAAMAQAEQDMRDAEVEATRAGADATMAGIGQKDKEIELGAANAEADRELAAQNAAEDRKVTLQTKKPTPGKTKPKASK